MEASAGNWNHLEASGVTQEAPKKPRKLPGDSQEATRRHPGDTQEAPRDTRRHPGDTRRYPGDTQETPGDPQGFLSHAWRNVAQRGGCARTVKWFKGHSLTPLMGSRTSVPGTSKPAASVNDKEVTGVTMQQTQKLLRKIIKRSTNEKKQKKAANAGTFARWRQDERPEASRQDSQASDK